LLNQPCSVAFMAEYLKSLRASGLAAILSILMVRVSVAAATCMPRVLVLVQLRPGRTLPVVGSIFWSNSSPFHSTVVKVEENTSLSCWLTFGVEVAAGEAGP